MHFQKKFATGIHTAARITNSKRIQLHLFVDASSVELFADNGLTVMTDIFFPNQTMNKISIRSANGIKLKELSYSKMERIWK